MAAHKFAGSDLFCLAPSLGQPPATGSGTLVLTLSDTDCPTVDSQCLSTCQRGPELPAVSMGHQDLSPKDYALT